MAFTTPRTWVTAELMTAALLNTYIRDNQSAIVGGHMAITSQAVGDTLYASSATQLARLAVGTANQIQTSSGSAPQWSSNLAISGTAIIEDQVTFGKATSGGRQFTVQGTLDSDAIVSIRNTAAADSGTENVLELMSGSYSARNLGIQSDGDVVNTNNSYGAISDERIKQDIQDASSQWDDIQAVAVRKFKLKADVAQHGEDAESQLGVISQELEVVSPGLILDTVPAAFQVDQCGIDAAGTVKAVKYSVLQMKALKALQEAMARIETLEARVTELENA